MKMLLMKENCYDPIIIIAPEEIDEAFAEYDRKNQKAWNFIGLSVENDQLVIMRSATNGREAWDSLKAYHQKSTLSSKIRLMKQLFRFELKRGGNMQEHLQKISEKINECNDIGAVIDDNLAVSVIFASLNSDYDALVTALEAWDDDRLTPSTVKGKLIEEWGKKDFNPHGDEMAMEVSRDVRNRLSKKVGGNKNFSCYYCDAQGHIKKNCALYKRHLSEIKKSDEDESAKMARYAEWYSNCFNQSISGDWFIDSGASCHMSNDKNVFLKIDDSKKGKVVVANGGKINIHGKGDVLIGLKKDKRESFQVKLNDVMFVPDLENNLVSVKKLTEKGFSVIF